MTDGYPSHLRITNPMYGVQPATNDPQVTVEGPDQHVSIKGRFAEKVQSQIRLQGILQIVIGSMCIISQTVVIIWALYLYNCLWTAFFFISSTEPVPSDAAGIWCGVMFAASGIVGVFAAKRNTRKWVTAYLICSVISSLLVFVVIGMAFLNISDVNNLLCSHQNTLPYLFDGLMIAGAALELILSIWSTILTCDARYGCCRGPEPEQYYNVMYNQRSASAAGPSTDEQLPSYSELNIPESAKY